MSNLLIDETDSRICSLISKMERLRVKLSAMRADCKKRPLNGDVYMSDMELSGKLKVSRNTLQQWRSKGIIPYILVRGKVLYRERDVQALLDVHYHQAWE